ncbi:MAG: ABC transporter ATP-binding protein [Rhizobiales bacterium]|nr:ABC transporter ATP-binding protein [Hyphomicrobiales bacterium]
MADPPSLPSSLEGRGVTVRFGGLAALQDVSLKLTTGQVLGLIGPNGAGKTTLVNVFSGFQAATEGSLLLDGTPIDHLSAQARARLGLVRTFQAVRLFPDLPVIANVEVSALARGAGRAEARATGYELLDWMGVSNRAGQRGSTLPYSDERKVGIARALALRPKFLLLDEPAAGMHEGEAEALLERIVTIPRTFGCGVLLIEHNMRLVMAASDRLHVIEFGRTLAEGTPEEIKADSRVIEAYLGAEEAEDKP